MASPLALAVVAAVVTGAYDPGSVPSEPAHAPKPSGRVLHAGRAGIQAAVDRARPGDTIRIAPGRYRGTVVVRGASKRGVRLLADRATLRGAVRVRDTASVAVRGLRVRGAVEVDGVDRPVLDGLRVEGGGVTVRRSPGGSIDRVLVRGSAGPGITIASTPSEVRAVRTFVRDVSVEANAVGIALDGVRAVTVTRARVLGNATGVTARDVRDGVLTDSDVQGSQVAIALTGAPDLLLAGNRLRANVIDVAGAPG